jgi:hypothetical protein
MQIEAGKFYRTRDGRKVEIDRVNDAIAAYVMRGRVENGFFGENGWTREGRFDLTRPNHPADLVAEWTEQAPADPEVQSEFDALKDRVGRLRDSVDERLGKMAGMIVDLTRMQDEMDAAGVKLEQRIVSIEAGARVQAATIRRLSDQVGGLLCERVLPAAVAADPVRAEAERAGPPSPRDAALAGEVTGDVGKPALPGGSVRELAEENAALRREVEQLRRAIWDAEAHIKRMGARA